MVNVPNEIERAQYVALTTFRRNGIGVATPVWFASDRDKLYLYSAVDAGKMKRVRATGKVSVVPCDLKGQVAAGAVPHLGSAVELPADRGDFVHGLLNRKYGWKKHTMEFFMAIPEKLRLRKVSVDGFVEITLD